ncbi:MAG TPA: histidine kinase [Gemmatimonadaceae bacterium]|nr:histidine kinase [Gemmatimonadaceae bacterium]
MTETVQATQTFLSPPPSALSELHPALLQGAVTLFTALLCWYLYARYRRRHLAWWASAWSLYVLRIGAIVAFLLTVRQPWLYVHQVLTGATALVLLWAALDFSDRARWRPAYAWALLFPVAWSYIAIYHLRSFLLAAVPAVLFLSFATLWTAGVFFALWRRTRLRGAAVLAGVLFAWGLHHLDYPALRARGAWNPWGYYLDIMFVLAMGVGIVILMLEQLDQRTVALERLSSRMVQQHEEERRRLSLELHDQSAQVWAAVKLQLGLARESAPSALAPQLDRVLSLVDAGIQSIRSVTTNLRPPLLDDLGLLPALRALVRSFAEQTQLAISFDAPANLPAVSNDAALALFRALQEALSNVARHSGATSADVRVLASDGALTLLVRDNGRGFADAGAAGAQTLGLAGMRERIGALHGAVTVTNDGGASVAISLPLTPGSGP